VGTPFTERTGYDLTGRGGVRLSEYWADGMRTLHGIHVHHFPNAFIVQPFQGANLISNVPHNLVDSAATIAAIIGHALAGGQRAVQVTKKAEQDWLDLLHSGPGGNLGGPDCTPGYYNNEGQDLGPAQALPRGYPQGAAAYFSYIDRWRAAGTFEGLEFTS
jgi:cyclohexanone monooxygenase